MRNDWDKLSLGQQLKVKGMTPRGWKVTRVEQYQKDLREGAEFKQEQKGSIRIFFDVNGVEKTTLMAGQLSGSEYKEL